MTAETLGSLSNRERDVIQEGARYGLLTADTLRQLRYADLSDDAVRKILARMAERGWLVRHLLRGQEPYFVLGQPALAALGLRRPTKALGHQALLEHYAVLLACARKGRAVITDSEFRAALPELCQPGLSSKNFFVDGTTDPPRLGWFLVDHDKLTSRMVGKVGRRVGKILSTDLPAFRRLVLDGLLAVHIVTATEGKRQNLEAAFARRRLGVPVTVEAYPDLNDFFLVKRR